jgi:uncharacterized protein YeaO (DUF488 family)
MNVIQFYSVNAEYGCFSNFKRYLAELDNKSELLDVLRRRLSEGPVTFVFAAKDEEHNSAVVLKEFLERGPRP